MTLADENFRAVRCGGELEPLQHRVGPALGLGGGQVVQAPHHDEVLVARQVLVDRGVLARQADLVARCLEPRACDRYPDAAALADDLRRHLGDQPLRGVVNRDPR